MSRKKIKKLIIGFTVIFSIVLQASMMVTADGDIDTTVPEVTIVTEEPLPAAAEEYIPETIVENGNQMQEEEITEVSTQETVEVSGTQEVPESTEPAPAENSKETVEGTANLEDNENSETDGAEETGKKTDVVITEIKEPEPEQKIYYFNIPYLESLPIRQLSSLDMHTHGLLKRKGYNEIQIAVIMAFADPNAIAYCNFGEYEDSYIKFTKKGRAKLRLWLKKHGDTLTTLDNRVCFLTEIIPWAFTVKKIGEAAPACTYEEWLQQGDISTAASIFIDVMKNAGIVSESATPNIIVRAQAYYSLFLSGTVTRYGLNGVEHMLQLEYTYVPYNKGSVEDSGCGVTCFSMAASHLTGLCLSPDVTGYWGYLNGANTVIDWSAYEYLANRFGITVEGRYDPRIAGYGYAIDALLNGKLVIASLYGGIFTETDAGHYILLTGIAGDGTLFVNDPISYEKSIGRTYLQGEVFGNCVQYWVLSL